MKNALDIKNLEEQSAGWRSRQNTNHSQNQSLTLAHSPKAHHWRLKGFSEIGSPKNAPAGVWCTPTVPPPEETKTNVERVPGL